MKEMFTDYVQEENTARCRGLFEQGFLCFSLSKMCVKQCDQHMKNNSIQQVIISISN